jgi:hypothetical protein
MKSFESTTLPIHAKPESVLPAYAGDQLISSYGFGIQVPVRLRKLGVDRRSAVKSHITGIQ